MFKKTSKQKHLLERIERQGGWVPNEIYYTQWFQKDYLGRHTY